MSTTGRPARTGIGKLKNRNKSIRRTERHCAGTSFAQAPESENGPLIVFAPAESTSNINSDRPAAQNHATLINKRGRECIGGHNGSHATRVVEKPGLSSEFRFQFRDPSE
jgi:hypothetical protein